MDQDTTRSPQTDQEKEKAKKLENQVPPWYKNAQEIPSDITDFQFLRDGTTLQTAFLFLAYELVGCVVGKRQWKTLRTTKRISEVVTVSDEAFLLLVLENHWNTLHDPDDENGDTSTKAKGKYTVKGTNETFKGWTEAGIKWYNEIYRSVQQDREDAEEAEDKAKEMFKLWDGVVVVHGKVLRRRKRKFSSSSPSSAEGGEGTSTSRVVALNEIENIAV